MNKSMMILLAVLLSVIMLAGVAEAAKPQCRDGIDNDGDGLADYPDDPGCNSKNDRNELGTNECDDGIDNDGDGYADTADSGCSSASGADETDCGDGVCEGGETSGSCPVDCGQPDSCSDTDGGYVTAVFGTTSGYYNNAPYSSADVCVDTSLLREYYCSGDYSYSSVTSCGADTYSAYYCSSDDVYQDFTDSFCASGACDSTTTPQLVEDCGTDGYGSEYCMSGDVYQDYTDNFCASGACDSTITPELIEACGTDRWGSAYCSGDDVYHDYTDNFCASGACDSTVTPYIQEDCPGTCTAGSCDDACIDSDYGWNYFVAGNTTSYSGSYWVDYDYCLDNMTVVEFGCSGTTVNNITYDCGQNSTICMGGRCVI